LQDLLAFYDRFARQNEANPRLQLEAAWAQRRVGAIYDGLGRRDEAERAYARASDMLEGLVARHPGVADYRPKLVETYIMANPWTADPALLPVMEARLRRAEAHAELLAADSPQGTDWVVPMVHVQSKLGTVLRRSGRTDEAEARYRRAIDLARKLLNADPANARARLDRADTLEALALLELDRGRRDRAGELLDLVADELDEVVLDGPMPSVADRFNDLAEDYRALGVRDRAEAIDRRARQLRGGGPHPPGP
jgi:tetratricopeptide (TPR) repeat protein